MSLKSVSASKDVIGDLPLPWAINYQSIRLVVIQNEGERRRWVDWPGQLFPFVRLGHSQFYGGKRCVFKGERNKGKVGQDRSARGREFQMDMLSLFAACRRRKLAAGCHQAEILIRCFNAS